MRKIWLLLLVMVSLLWASNSIASGAYSVDVSVDVVDSDASKAREKAMVEANRTAFVEALKNIATPDSLAELSSLPSSHIINFIKEVSVLSEKTSDVRYIADLRVSINDKILKEYMREKGMPVVLQSTSNILIVPTFRDFPSDSPLLWEENNIWKAAWEINQSSLGRVNFQTIPSTGANYASIDAGKALSLDAIALDKLMRLNGVDDVYVVDATFDGIEGLNIRFHSFANGNNAFESLHISGNRSDSTALFSSAIDTIKKHISDGIKQQSVVENSQENTTVIMYSFDNLRDMLGVEKRLKSIANIKEVIVEAAGSNKVQYKIVFVGTPEKLIAALQSRSLNLVDNGSFFVLEQTAGDY